MNLHDLANDPQAFRDALRVDINGQLKSYGKSLRPWQRQNHADVDPALRCLAGYGEASAVEWWRIYHEMTRGSTKTTAVAANMGYLVFAARRKLVLGIYASDRDQSRIAKDIVGDMVRNAPWLQSVVRVDRDKVVNTYTGSELRVESSDESSSWGLNLDAVVCEEFGAWDAGAEGLWHSIISTAAKRERCLVHIATNSGWKTSWQAPLVAQIQSNSRWKVAKRDTPPEWITPDNLREQQDLLSTQAYQRLWCGQWVDDVGFGLNPSHITRSIVRSGPCQVSPAECVACSIGLDLGLDNDATGITVWGWSPRRGKLLLLESQRWLPREHGGEIQIDAVRRELIDLRKRFDPCVGIASDSWQARGLLQSLFSAGFRNVYAVAPTAATCDQQAKTLIDALRDNVLEVFEGDLVKDMRSATVVERPGGLCKLTYPRDARGHSDVLAAAASVLPLAMQDLRTMQRGIQEQPPQHGQPIDCTAGGRWEAANLDFAGQPRERIEI